jgi:hypothetical protein
MAVNLHGHVRADGGHFQPALEEQRVDLGQRDVFGLLVQAARVVDRAHDRVPLAVAILVEVKRIGVELDVDAEFESRWRDRDRPRRRPR